MKKTIYLHIGAHKTGTTALQKFLSINRANLIKNGYFYPKPNAHHFIPHGLKNNTLRYSNPSKLTEIVIEKICKSNHNNIIISSEEFEFLNEKEILLLKKRFEKNFIITIIFYIRRQDELIESRYNQMVKNKPQYSRNISNFISEYPEELDNYLILSPWRKVFGQENLIVRIFEKQQLINDIFEDFLTAIGLEINENYRIPEDNINSSLEWDFIEFIRLCNVQFHKNIKLNHFLISNFEKINLGGNRLKRHLLSPLQRHDIMERYKESNTKVAREYLGRQDGRLFYSPLPDPDEPWEPYEGLTIEKVVPIFTQMLYNMDVKYQKQIKIMQNNPYKTFINKKLRLSLNVLKRWKTNLFK